MFRKYILYLLFLIVYSVNLFAGDTGKVQSGYLKIEAAERQAIIDEFTYRLDTDKNCKPIQKWTDKGSGADLDGYFFVPSVKENFFMVGGFGTRTRKTSLCVITVREPKDNPENTPELLVEPIGWELIWTDKGSGAEMDGSMWRAVPPDNNYRCIGSVPQTGYIIPVLKNYRCVHVSLTKKIVSNSLIWSDKGSNADKQVTMFGLPNTNSFVAVSGRINKIETYDLKTDAKVTPDPRLVEEKLTMRMQQIQQDLEAGLMAEMEQKKLAGETEQKQLAEEAEQKKLAEETEQKRLAEEAKQEKLTEETKQKRLAEEAKQEKLAEETKQKRLAEEAKQEKLAGETEQARLADEEKQKLLAEEAKLNQLAKEEIKTEVAVTSKENTTTDVDDNKSSGTSSLVMFFVKITLVVIGLFIFLGIIFYVFIKLLKNKEAA